MRRYSKKSRPQPKPPRYKTDAELKRELDEMTLSTARVQYGFGAKARYSPGRGYHASPISIRTGGEPVKVPSALEERAHQEAERQRERWRRKGGGKRWLPEEEYIRQKRERGEPLTPYEAHTIGVRVKRTEGVIRRRPGAKGIASRTMLVRGYIDALRDFARANQIPTAMESVLIPYAKTAREGDSICGRRNPPGCDQWRVAKEQFHRTIWQEFGKCNCIAGARLPAFVPPGSEHLAGMGDQTAVSLYLQRQQQREKQRELARVRKDRDYVRKEVARMSPSEFYKLLVEAGKT